MCFIMLIRTNRTRHSRTIKIFTLEHINKPLPPNNSVIVIYKITVTFEQNNTNNTV